MRIAMVCSNHPVNDARIVFKQAASLAAAGHEVRVFGLEAAAPVHLPGVTVEAVYPFKIGIRARVSATPKLYGPVLRWKPDVVTGHEPETAALGLHLRSLCGARVVFDVHELWQETMARRAPRPIRPMAQAAFAEALRCIGRRVDWITTVSPPIRDFYRAVRRDGRVDLIYNSPPIETFPPCRQDVEGPVVVAHEGSLDVQRGMLEMLEALAMARRSAEVRLLIVGGVREWDRARFDEKVSSLGLAAAIDSPGWVSYEGVGRLLSQSQIGIVAMQPSTNNYVGLSNKLFNYMCCGLAVIVPEGSMSADLVRRADCGVAVDTTRPEAIAGAIVRLARDPALRQRLGANGRRAVEQTYGWHKMAERLVEIYARLE
jgi:glycosyltransferase involved in cell wall biosynthesis